MSQHVVTLADDPDNLNRDELFVTVRDGEPAEAKEDFGESDLSWLHSSLQQNMLFFVATPCRRGCEFCDRRRIRLGVDLEQADQVGSYRQTPLFWAAARRNLNANLEMVKSL